MRIVLEMQGVQLEIASGIRNGALALVTSEILRQRGEHEIVLALRARLGDTVEQVRAVVHALLPLADIRVWHAPGPLDRRDALEAWPGLTAACILEAFISSIDPDVVVIPQFIGADSSGWAVSLKTDGKRYKTAVLTASARPDTDPGQPSPPTANPPDRQDHYLNAELIWATRPQTGDPLTEHTLPDVDRVNNLSQRITWEAPELLAARLMFEIGASHSPLQTIAQRLTSATKKKLAYISPLPPQRSGISDYSADLLPELARFYDVEVIIEQAELSSTWISENCKIRDVDWALNNIEYYDRIIYHFGNSSFHYHMFAMLARMPGVVVLHDFFLGDVSNFIEAHHIFHSFYSQSLYHSHGYKALFERFTAENPQTVINKYPTNLPVLQNAKGIIVHSKFSQQLADTWYGEGFSDDWSVIPLLRKTAPDDIRDQAREMLGFQPEDFLVCSFGLLGPTKLNHILLAAWLESELVHNSNCHLIFVGENHGGEYGAQLNKLIKANGCQNRIRITGWADDATFHRFLAAADVAVQLRTQSRGETSAAVLDCMNFALPTIVNAHGSFTELPIGAVWMLSEKFDNNELTLALEALWRDPSLRQKKGAIARTVVQDQHNPATCAHQYADAIEFSYAGSEHSVARVIGSIAALESLPNANDVIEAVARSIAMSLPDKKVTRQLLVDVSATCRNDLKTGIQRVVRALVWEFLHAPPTGWRVEPVYLTDEGGIWHYRYARQWTSDMLGIPSGWMADDSVDFSSEDVLLVADFTSRFAVEAERSGLLTQLREIGIAVHYIVYDLLPIIMPEYFPPGQFGFSEWIKSITRSADGAICISRAVAQDLKFWVSNHPEQRVQPLEISWFHLGADIDRSVPTNGIPQNARKLLSLIDSFPSFLMVGTIEPRKGYIQVIEAFTRLWEMGARINLVIVGKEGWLGLPDSERRTIPEIVRRLQNHPQLGKQLLWLDSASDEFLVQIYNTCTCLIAASEGEGFGLPLIEAAQHGIPVIARDIPVFREVAGQHAYFFDGLAPENLVDALTKWIDLNKKGATPVSRDMPWLTWKQSSDELLEKLGLTRSEGHSELNQIPAGSRGS